MDGDPRLEGDYNPEAGWSEVVSKQLPQLEAYSRLAEGSPGISLDCALFALFGERPELAGRLLEQAAVQIDRVRDGTRPGGPYALAVADRQEAWIVGLRTGRLRADLLVSFAQKTSALLSPERSSLRARLALEASRALLIAGEPARAAELHEPSQREYFPVMHGLQSALATGGGRAVRGPSPRGWHTPC